MPYSSEQVASAQISRTPGPVHPVRSPGYPFTKSLLRDRWKEACAKAGVSGLTWHGLRADFITRLLDDGTPIHHVKDAVGHADLATTMRYGVSRKERQLEAMVRSERLAAERRAARAKARNRHAGNDPKRKVVD